MVSSRGVLSVDKSAEIVINWEIVAFDSQLHFYYLAKSADFLQITFTPRLLVDHVKTT